MGNEQRRGNTTCSLKREVIGLVHSYRENREKNFSPLSSSGKGGGKKKRRKGTSKEGVMEAHQEKTGKETDMCLT